MREIKFRGIQRFGENKGKWAFGSLLILGLRHYIVPIPPKHETPADDITLHAQVCERVEVSAESVGQSTGLKDENGKGTNEAYKDDIVIISCKSGSKLRFKGVVKYSAPEFHVACFCSDIDGKQYWYPVGENNRSLIQGFWSIDEIIGNIHTTPELMEKPK